ncbi:MAG: dihydroorotase [Pseudomonadota bacterium]
MKQLTLRKPDDWHVHLRDGESLNFVVPATARQFARAIVMPNLTPPVTTVEHALAYRERILAATDPKLGFEPLMTLYLTDVTDPDTVRQAKASPYVHAVKYYPAGATTNSESGVTKIDNVMGVLETMAEVDLPLLVHGEVTDHGVDIFDREKVFIHDILEPVLQRIPDLRVVFEHITTRDAVEFVTNSNARIGATITPQHLLFDRNDIFKGGIRPHYYCLPILKRSQHRAALLEAATSGNPKFFLGTDSAPHSQASKESSCGCAGIYSAHSAIELYAKVFEAADALDQLEAFASLNGPNFYGLKLNTETITLARETWQLPKELPFTGDDKLIPLLADDTLDWKLVTNHG